MTNQTTAEIIAGMLTENTGSHMLDSGGAYGRYHEKNQGRDFASEPAITLSFKSGWIEVSKSLYHYLLEHLTYDHIVDNLFQRFSEERKDSNWLVDAQDFPQFLEDELQAEITGPFYNDGKPISDNSYNHENLLDQVIQYTAFASNGTPYLILQIHGGCDVRGGYTAPKVFEIASDDYAFFSDMQNATIGGIEPEQNFEQLTMLGVEATEPQSWYTDDTNHWYKNDGCNNTELQNYNFLNEEDLDDEQQASDFINKPNNGLIFVDSEGNGYCPITGFKLEVY